MSTGFHQLESPSIGLRGEFQGRTAPLVGSGLLTLLILLVPLLSMRQMTWLTQEDGIVEWTTALLFLLSAIACGWGAWRRAGRQRVGLVVWAALAILFMGEEVSWFQRVIGFSTPEFLEGNVQGEANFHNLPALTPHEVTNLTDLITSQGLFYAGFFAYFALFPALCAVSPPLTRLANRWGFVPVPWAGMLTIWLPILVSFFVAALLPHGLKRFGLTEIRELIFALAIAGYAWWICTRAPSEPAP
jgi:hypothetical protein